MDPIRVGVLGLGKMGRHHVRCAGLAAGVELTVVSDVDPDQATGIGDTFFTTDPNEFAQHCDAAILAVPTDRHATLGAHLLERGCHLLVEKPLAATAGECASLAKAAAAAKRVLRVGHVERLNGAYRAARHRISTPRFIEGHRLAAFDPRGTEVDVVLDLMIHDLDLVLDLFGAEPTRVEAVGVPVLTGRVDIANARLEFPGGALVNLTASRASREPVRKLRLFQEDRYLSLDLQKQQAEIYERNPQSPIGIAHEKLDSGPDYNPLVCEIEGFAAAIRGEADFVATAEEGLRAVRLAERIKESIETRRGLWTPHPGDAPWPGAPS